ncbi:MAG: DUF3306 domain-containing protein [Burkholderiales bacterium]
MVDDEKKSAGEPFLSRWSQKKQQAREQPPTTPLVEQAETPLPDLPPVEELTTQSDFSVFMHPKVDPDLRRAALKKLFSDPHFNVMDGLDTYIDDYSQPDPLPPGMLAGLRQAQNILAWAKETKEETAARFAQPPVQDTAPTPDERAALPADVAAAPPHPAVAADSEPATSAPAAAARKS